MFEIICTITSMLSVVISIISFFISFKLKFGKSKFKERNNNSEGLYFDIMNFKKNKIDKTFYPYPIETKYNNDLSDLKRAYNNLEASLAKNFTTIDSKISTINTMPLWTHYDTTNKLIMHSFKTNNPEVYAINASDKSYLSSLYNKNQIKYNYYLLALIMENLYNSEASLTKYFTTIDSKISTINTMPLWTHYDTTSDLTVHNFKTIKFEVDTINKISLLYSHTDKYDNSKKLYMKYFKAIQLKVDKILFLYSHFIDKLVYNDSKEIKTEYFRVIKSEINEIDRLLSHLLHTDKLVYKNTEELETENPKIILSKPNEINMKFGSFGFKELIKIEDENKG